MIRRAVAVAAIGFLVSPAISATASPSRDQKPHFTGTIVTPSGHRVVGAQILASVHETGPFATCDFFCHNKKAISGRHGHFTVRVPPNDTANRGYAITATVPRRKASVSTSIILKKTSRRGLHVGDLFVADGGPHVRAAGQRRHLKPPILPTKFRATNYRALAQPAGSNPDVGESRLAITHGYDVRALEDERMRLTTSQRGSERGRVALFGSTFIVKGHQVPPSRGSKCWVTGHRGQLVAQHPCDLTDGALDQTWTPQDDPACANDGKCGGRKYRDAIIGLRHPVKASLIVVRGCRFQCTVQVRGKGSAFRTVAESGSHDDILTKTLDEQVVKQVRIRYPTSGFFRDLREVSVFGR